MRINFHLLDKSILNPSIFFLVSLSLSLSISPLLSYELIWTSIFLGLFFSSFFLAPLIHIPIRSCTENDKHVYNPFVSYFINSSCHFIEKMINDNKFNRDRLRLSRYGKRFTFSWKYIACRRNNRMKYIFFLPFSIPTFFVTFKWWSYTQHFVMFQEKELCWIKRKSWTVMEIKKKLEIRFFFSISFLFVWFWLVLCGFINVLLSVFVCYFFFFSFFRWFYLDYSFLLSSNWTRGYE